MRILQSPREGRVFAIAGARAAAIGALAVVCVMSAFGTGLLAIDRSTGETSAIGEAPAIDEAPAVAEDARAVEPAAAAQEAPALRLHGVVLGRRPVADIDGRVVRLGETFDAGGVTYTLRAIAGKSVTLADAANREIVLRLGGPRRAAAR